MAFAVVWLMMYFNSIIVYWQENKDYYAILGIQKTANEKEIK